MEADFVVGGLQVAALVLLAVQALKVYGFVTGENAPKAAVLVALVLGAVGTVEKLVPVAAPYVAIFVQVLAGALTAGLGYEYLVRPLAERFGISVSSTELDK